MDINARINWKPGMELTAQTFLDQDANLDFRQQMAIRAALGDNCMGVLPGAPLNCQGAFYTNKFEIDRLECTAILPSGQLIQVDEDVSINIPMLYGDEYYLTVGFGNNNLPFERDGVPYIRPQYVYAIQTMDEVKASNTLPITHILVSDGVFTVDTDYILPSLLLSADNRFDDFHERYADLLYSLAGHANFKEGDGKRAMQRYLFVMKSFDMQGRVADFVSLTQEIAQAIDYFIMKPNGRQDEEIPRLWMGDISKWLKWFENFLSGAVTLLDGVELEDDTIDYNALLAQAKKELYEQLNPELHEKLLQQIKEELRDELTSSLSSRLTEYMDNTVKPELGRILSSELHEKLYEKLYTELFEQLFNALYVPEQKEKEFIPLI